MIGGNGQKLVDIPQYHRRPGGAPANLAVAASRLGAEVSMTATVGKDHFGELMFRKLENEGVDTSGLRKIDENTTLAFVSLKQNAEPEFSFFRGADQKISEEQIKDDQETIHIGSLPLTQHQSAENILDTIKETDSKVSFDPNLRRELINREYLKTLEKVINHTDILFAAEEEISELGGVEQLLKQVNEIVVTKGQAGAKVITQHKTCSFEPPKVEVEDTTGAGDALAGAFLAFRKEGIKTALEKAVYAASLSVREKGAMTALPTHQELKSSMEDI
jgi:fructokinase